MKTCYIKINAISFMPAGEGGREGGGGAALGYLIVIYTCTSQVCPR